MKFRDYINELNEEYERTIRIININTVMINDQYNESKQVGTIYHFTEPAWIENIIKNGKLELNNEKYVSFTRNPSLPDIEGYFHKAQYCIRLSFDGNKMSNNLKISPIKDSKYSDESEEGILRKVSLRYLKQIDIKPNTVYNKKMLEYIIELCKKHNIKCNFTSHWKVIK